VQRRRKRFAEQDGRSLRTSRAAGQAADAITAFANAEGPDVILMARIGTWHSQTRSWDQQASLGRLL